MRGRTFALLTTALLMAVPLATGTVAAENEDQGPVETAVELVPDPIPTPWICVGQPPAVVCIPPE